MNLYFPAGGYNREECLRTVECYDPKEDRWTFIAPMRTPRARFQMAVLMVQFIICLYLWFIDSTIKWHFELWHWRAHIKCLNRFYLSCANTCTLNPFSVQIVGFLYSVSRFEVHITKRVRWMNDHLMTLLQGQLYVIGGSNGHSDELSCGERYDPHADEWAQVPELRTNRCNAGQSFLLGFVNQFI